MGGGKDQKTANNMIQQQGQWQSDQAKQFEGRNESDMNASQGRGNDLYNQMKEGYTSLLSPAQQAAQASGVGGGSGGGGGVAAPGDSRFGESENSYRNFMGTGGWDPDRKASMDSNIQAFKQISKTGGVDAEGQNRMRGNGVFDEFQKTGGYNEGDKANIRARATSVIPAMYSRMRDEANRMSSVQGGYGPGKTAMMSRLARDNASGISGAARDAELGIMDKVNSGRQWGTQGMAESEGALQDLMSRNKLTSLAGASDTEQRLVDSINQGKMFGTQGLEGMAQADRSAAMSSGAMSAANSHWDQDFAFRQKMAGLEGLGSLYTSAPSEYMANKDFDLQNRGMGGTQVGNLGTGLKTGNRNPWDTVAGFAGGALGAL